MDEMERNAEGQLNRLLIINMLYTFIVSALAIIVPLYLLENKVDIAYIGLILSIGPISFMVIRILLASMADEIGTRKIASVYSLSNLAAIAVYALAASPVGFAAGTLLEGIRASGFWAITRTEVMRANGEAPPGQVLARFSNMRQLADGLGRLSVGIVLAYLAFSGAFALFFIFSLALLALILTSEERTPGTLHVDGNNIRRIFKRHPPTFWTSAVLQGFLWLAYNSLVGFLLPVYLISSLGFDNSSTGLLIALMSLVTAASALLFVRLHVPKRAMLLLCFVSVPALLYFPFAHPDEVLPLLMIISIGYGCGNIVGEYLLADQVFRSKDVSTDTGVLFAPLKVAEFLFLSLGGVVISSFGYVPLFFLLALSLSLFVLLGRVFIRPVPH
jgi:MFS family permease